MTKKQWLANFETAHGRQPSDEELAEALQAGEFLDSNQEFTVSKANLSEETRSPSRRLKRGMKLILGVALVLVIVTVALASYFGHRYQEANIGGNWVSQSFSDYMKGNLLTNSSTQKETGDLLPQGSDLITDVKTTMQVVGDKAKLSVSFVYNRKALYQSYKTKVEELKKKYEKDYNSDFIAIVDANSLNEDQYYEQFDQTIQAELPKSYHYDTKTGSVTTVAFEGDVDRWNRTITVSQTGDADGFRKGDVLNYLTESSGFVLKAHNNFGDISFTQNN